MTEDERCAQLAAVLDYWFPIRWDLGGHQYERLSYEFTGDTTLGGVSILVSRDGEANIAINFTNENGYGDARLDAIAAMDQFLTVFGS